MRKHIAWLVSILILTTGIGFTNTENIFASSDTIEHQLAKLDGVTKVTKLEMEKETGDLDEKFMLYFEQPLDWEHPEKGTFTQRVELGIRSNAEANALLTNGYNMNESLFAVDTDPEGLTALLNANYIQVEHRFFGGSRPEGMRDDNSNFEDWYEYYNLKNSTADFHKIYTELSKVLGEDKWIAYGRSYRGIMTNAYAYYYPDDMDVYLPYCAPTSCGMDDERFYDNMYKTIGDDREDGAELRKLFTDFQVELMRNKEELMPIFKEALEKDGGTYTEFATPERVFDITVLEFAVQMWQRKVNQTTELGEDVKTLFPRVMLKSEDTEEEKQAKLEEQIEILTTVQSFDWATNTPFFPYYISACTELGQYHYNFDYLRQAMQEAGVPAENLSITKEMEPTILQDLMFTPAQKKVFKYSSHYYDAVTRDIKTTETKHLMLLGADDPWAALRMPIEDGDNPNVKVYLLQGGDHYIGIGDFPEETQKEIINQLEEWLKSESSENQCYDNNNWFWIALVIASVIVLGGSITLSKRRKTR